MTRRDFEVTKNSKLKNRLIDHRFFTADFQFKIEKSINQSSIFYSQFSIRLIFLNLIDFDQKIFKNRQHKAKWMKMLACRLCTFTSDYRVAIRRTRKSLSCSLCMLHIFICWVAFFMKHSIRKKSTKMILLIRI